MFKHIVVGTNHSSEGRDAVALGGAIAVVTGARLSLVGVFSPSLLPVPGVSDRKTLRAQAARALRAWRDLHAPDALIHTIADPSVPRALRHFAQRSHADLIILGSSRSAQPGHVRIGRTGRQLLYDAPFSLGLAACGLHEQEAGLRAVGVAYDGGPEAESALALAAQLSGAAQARLLVRRVVEDRVPVLSGEAWIALEDWSHDDMWAEAREQALAEARDAASRFDMPREVSATVGEPGDEMRVFSSTVDLLVLGSRRWGPLARLVTGGVGETLVSDAGCSIIIVPRPSAAERRGGAGRRRVARPVLV